jgi:hypothetical protein
LVSRRLYQLLGLVFGFVLVDYGFNLISVGLEGARALTSQFLAINLLVGGSALAFMSLYYLLKPITPAQAKPVTPQPVGDRPDVGVEIVVEEETPPKVGFYRKIEYIGYIFTFLGLISAAGLVMQVFIRSTYYEGLWWIEVLLVTFGVLSYVIFGSVGRLGRQEEANLTSIPTTAATSGFEPHRTASSPTPSSVATVEASEPITLELTDFTRNSEREYERHLSGESYDMFRVDQDLVTVWREDRRGLRSVYLAGPYELTKKMLEEHLRSEEELRVGNLVLPVEEIRGLLQLTNSGKEASANVSVPREV